MCINSQNINQDLTNYLNDNWSDIVQAFESGGCQAVQQLINNSNSNALTIPCQNGQGQFLAGCPEGINSAPRGSIGVPVCILPGQTCPYNPNCPSSESYVHTNSAPWTRPSAYLDLNRSWSPQKPFQL